MISQINVFISIIISIIIIIISRSHYTIVAVCYIPNCQHHFLNIYLSYRHRLCRHVLLRAGSHAQMSLFPGYPPRKEVTVCRTTHYFSVQLAKGANSKGGNACNVPQLARVALKAPVQLPPCKPHPLEWHAFSMPRRGYKPSIMLRCGAGTKPMTKSTARASKTSGIGRETDA